MIRHTFDPEVGAHYVAFDDGPVDRTEEVAPGVYVDLAADGHAVGIEVLGAADDPMLTSREGLADALERLGVPQEARAAVAVATR